VKGERRVIEEDRPWGGMSEDKGRERYRGREREREREEE
jgi:hypothetical protein